MKFIELFAGVGGFRYGLSMCNRKYTEECSDNEKDMSSPNRSDGDGGRANTFNCVWATEIGKKILEIYDPD